MGQVYLDDPLDPVLVARLQEHGDDHFHLLTPRKLLLLHELELRRSLCHLHYRNQTSLPSSLQVRQSILNEDTHFLFEASILDRHPIILIALITAKVLPLSLALGCESLDDDERVLLDALEEFAEDKSDELDEIAGAVRFRWEDLRFEDALEKVEACYLGDHERPTDDIKGMAARTLK
jgi:hypothetical protein